jgi:hypothetical protein
MDEALAKLKSVADLAKQKAEVASFGGELSEFYERILDECLSPFQETVTLEMLVEAYEHIEKTK